MNAETIRAIQEATERVIHAEHVFFASHGLDNDEHIPRLKRIADAIADLLREKGVETKTWSAVSKDLVNYGRQLFVEEWTKPLRGDDEPPTEEDAVREFDRSLTGRKR